MQNPLLEITNLPDFSQIKAKYIQPAISQRIQHIRENLEQSLNQGNTGWQNLIQPLEQWLDELNQTFSPISHLNSVANNDELRTAYNTCLPLISELYTELGQNERLYQCYKKLKDSTEFSQLNQAQQAAIHLQLRDFHLQGVALQADKKKRFADIQAELAKLASQFSENVLDATQSWYKLITNKKQLKGLPQSALDLLAQQAKEHQQQGFRLTLDAPSFLPIMMYCENRTLRKEVYIAYQTRASDIGQNANKFDNSNVMQAILRLKSELANLLGYANYSEYSIASKMAENSESVINFLTELTNKTKPQAQLEFAQLGQFAQEQLDLKTLEPWDISFASERLKNSTFSFTQEELKAYFPLPVVLHGLFKIVHKLYGIKIKPNSEVKTYHADVIYYELFDKQEKIAGFYLDVFSRNNKRGGAWMDECKVRRQSHQGIQLPVAYIVANFTPALNNEPALLTHNEVTTLFHEFGHGLQHMLTKMDIAAISGINGIPWDAVELPSQFFENWCYEPEALALISEHYEDKSPLPNALLEKLISSKNFQSAMQMLRQLEFALFDFKLHLADGKNVNIQTLLDEVREEVCVVPVVKENRFQHSFSHIFAGGYAAGYYSYKWAEVLSADAFSRFQEEGIFNAKTGQAFLQYILQPGGSEDALVLFTQFRGRKPRIEALLAQSGIQEQD